MDYFSRRLFFLFLADFLAYKPFLRVAVLGATGSIGSSSLSILRSNKELFKVAALSYHSNKLAFDNLVEEFKPRHAVCTASSAEAVLDILQDPEIDVVVVGVPGFAGLKLVVEALKNGKHLALANKESLVVAGGLVKKLAKENEATIVPVDSEHCSIMQCLVGADYESARSRSISEIVLTASGGPLLNSSESDPSIETVLAHPTWSMGAKISVDSATMMNKGLELIEAAHLFDVSASTLSVLVHPQSIIHGLVRFGDGNLLAAMSSTTMEAPFSFCFSYFASKFCGREIICSYPELALSEVGKLEFFEPDRARFPALRLCEEVLELPSSSAVVLNASNEVAVDAFLSGNMRYSEIVPFVEKALSQHDAFEVTSLEEVCELDVRYRV